MEIIKKYKNKKIWNYNVMENKNIEKLKKLEIECDKNKNIEKLE